MSSFIPHIPKQPAPTSEPVIEELVVETNDYGLLFAGDFTLHEWLGRADFRGFKFQSEYRNNTVFNHPWMWLNGETIMSEAYTVDATLVHASHVLREVAKCS